MGVTDIENQPWKTVINLQMYSHIFHLISVYKPCQLMKPASPLDLQVSVNGNWGGGGVVKELTAN